MSNFLRNVGLAATGAVPTLMRLDADKREQQRLDSQLKTEDSQRQSAAQMAALRGLQIKQAQQDIDDEDAVRGHIAKWRDGRAKIAQGDFTALEEGIKEYNANEGWGNDGRTLRPRPSDDGKATILDWYDGDGKLISSSPPLTREMALATFDNGMAEKLRFYSPKRFDDALRSAAAAKEKQADRESLERRAQYGADARMYGADVRGDTALDVAEIRAGAQRDTANIRASRPATAQGPKGLTAAQERSNAEIDAAREQITGLSEEDIRKRTTSTAASGRENPLFDPAIARAAKLAGRRKIGQDDHFDKRRNPATSLAQVPTDMADVIHADAVPQSAERQAKPTGTPKERAMASMAKDPAMKGYSLGDFDGHRFKVLDGAGRVVGYYGAK